MTRFIVIVSAICLAFPVDVCDAFLDSSKPNDVAATVPKVDTKNSLYDPITDWARPPPQVVSDVIEKRVQPLHRLVSPVFFSTDQKGRRHCGLTYLPDTKPLLFVGNHQLGGLDMWLFVPQLLEERNIWVRALGHPAIFDNKSFYFGGGPSFTDTARSTNFGLFQEFGVVQATPRNLYRLLQTGQSVLHFPGGAREAYHGRGEEYQLFWPKDIDFVRVAAKFNATIVPLSAIGAADSANVVLGPEDLTKLPFLGSAIANSPFTVRDEGRVRRNGDGAIRPPPLVIPKPLPARHYFLFGKPFPTEHLDPKDKEACRLLYRGVQNELEQCIDDLLRAREKDPYQDSAIRLIYERVTGKIAPTFGVDELN
jgi:1-acyl-sn-glycerol-3-phosphate acyltransferase